VLEVAHQLFYWRGIRATGVDLIAAEAGVAATALYRVFSGKDDLVAAYLRRAGEGYREWFEAAVTAGGSSPRDRILAVIDALTEQTRPEQCRGCPFLMALAEFPEPEHPARLAALEIKAWVRRRWGELADELTASRAADELTPSRAADELADHLALLMEGVYASTQAHGHLGPARRARSLAAALLGPPGALTSTHPPLDTEHPGIAVSGLEGADGTGDDQD
jgi:AcrR family transcriptional regulator